MAVIPTNAGTTGIVTTDAGASTAARLLTWARELTDPAHRAAVKELPGERWPPSPAAGHWDRLAADQSAHYGSPHSATT